MVDVTNVLYQESSYFKTIQTIEEWPSIHTKMGSNWKSDVFNIYTISTKNFNSIEDYISKYEENGLSHIIVDNKNRQGFLLDIFENEKEYSFLKKIYDSKNDEYTYHVKVFKIDYEIFDAIKNGTFG